MIPTIGYIIATYTVIRLIEMAAQKGEDSSRSAALSTFAVLGILITLGLTYWLFSQSMEATAQNAKSQAELQRLQNLMR